MSIPFHPEHLRRYRDVAWLLWKHGRADWVQESGLGRQVDTKEFNDARDKDGKSGPDALADDLESLGPTFVKLGQLLASRADLLPTAYLEGLARLQDNVKPVPYGEIEPLIIEELKARPSKIFAHIDSTPLAAASLAQVHAAKLLDGRKVVIKVQRPNIEEELSKDFEAFAAIAQLMSGFAWGQRYEVVVELVDEMRITLRDELDYKLEVNNLLAMRRNLEEFKTIHVPMPYPEFSSRRILTMEHISGTSISAVNPLVLTDVDGSGLAEELFHAYLKQMLIDGMFHADPHAGNVMLTKEGKIALIDLGMVGRIEEGLQQDLLTLLIAASEGHGTEAGEIALRIGKPGASFNRDEFLRNVADVVMRNKDAALADMEAGRLVLLIQKIAADCGVKLPRAMILVGKTLMNLDGIARKIAPGFNPNAAIRRHTMDLVERRARARFTPGSIYRSAIEATELAAQFPRRVNELLTQITQSGIRVDADLVDEKTLMEGFQKVANRITSGLVLAALIIGAALMMRVQTPFQLLGYPGLAIVLFLLAVVGGIVLLYQIFATDQHRAAKKE